MRDPGELPWLSDEEIAALCKPLVLPGAQCRYLRDTLKLHVERKPNGTPLVMRTELERAHGAARLGAPQVQNAATGPNVVGLEQWSKGRKRGTQTQGR